MRLGTSSQYRRDVFAPLDDQLGQLLACRWWKSGAGSGNRETRYWLAVLTVNCGGDTYGISVDFFTVDSEASFKNAGEFGVEGGPRSNSALGVARVRLGRAAGYVRAHRDQRGVPCR